MTPVQGLLLDAVDRLGHRDAGKVEDGRAHVVHVRVVAPNRARVADAARPVHDHRVPGAAKMRGDLLAPVERGVAGPGPPGRVMRSHLLVAPGLEPAVLEEEPHLLLRRERDPVERRQLVERAREGAFHARAVVAPDPHDDRVLELAHLVDRVDDPADVPVGVLGIARVDLHLAGVEALVRLVEGVPGRERVVARRQLCVGGDDAERLLTGERLLAHHVPALVERALVLVRPLARHVVRRVAAAGCDVGEPGRLLALGADPVQPVDRLVGEIVLEVVPLAVLCFRNADHLRVLGDQGVVLARLAAEEAPEVVEAEPGRPAVERPREALLVVRSEMPLPERSRQVAVLLEDARKRRAIVRDGGVVARERARELADHAEADAVVVAPRQQCGPGRRAERRDVEAVVAQPVVREPGVVRGLDRPPEGARVAEAGVVDQDEEDIRRALGRLHVARLVPVRLRVGERPVRRAAERRPPDRELAAVDFCVLHQSTPCRR